MRATRLRFLAEVNPGTPEFDALPLHAEVPFLPLEAVWPGQRLDTSRRRAKSDVANGYTRFREGDILIPKITPTFEADRTVLALGLEGGVAAGTTELHIVRPHVNVDSRFVRYVLNSRPFLLGGEASMIGVAGQKRVPEAWLKDFPVQVTAPGAQHAIADYLDAETARIEALIARKQRMIEVLAERFSAAISTVVFGDLQSTWGPVGRVTDVLPGYAFPSEQFRSEADGAYRLLRGVNVAPGRLRWDDTAYLARGTALEFDRYSLRPGDLVIGMDRPLIGAGMRVATVSVDDGLCLLVQRVARVRANQFADLEYLRFALTSQAFAAYFSPIVTGVSVPHISDEQIRGFRLPLPPIEVQRERASRLREVELRANDCSQALTHQIALFVEHRRALITSAVTGELAIPGTLT